MELAGQRRVSKLSNGSVSLISVIAASIVVALTACSSSSKSAAVTGGAPGAGGSTSTAENSSSGGTGTTSTASTTSTGGSTGVSCTGLLEEIQSTSGLCVTKMATITAPSGSSDYDIGATEVTKGQYDAWLATKPALPANSDTNCAWKTSYDEQCPGYTGTDSEHHPVVCVDWCDSYAYCAGVGKRLCGTMGVGSNTYESYADASASQWYRACSSGGTNTYPYGNTYQTSFCNGFDYSTTHQTATVGSLGTCVTSTTGYAGAYDLSGNVWEWEDSCEGSEQSANCRLRGGSYFDDHGSSDLACGNGYFASRDFANGSVGFRCCSR